MNETTLLTHDEVASAPELRLSQNSVFGYLIWNRIPPKPTVYTSTVSATVFGGRPPFSFDWTMVSGDSSVQAVNPNSSSTAFRANSNTDSFQVQAVYRARVTDAESQTATADVTVTIEREAY